MTAEPQSPQSPQTEAARRSPLRLALALGLLAFAIGAGISWLRLPTVADVGPGAQDAARSLLQQSLPDAAGKPVDLALYRGRVVVVNFWATWCPPCVEEMPELSALAGEFPTERVQVLGIGVDSATNVAEFARKHQISYPLLVAGAGALDMLRELGNTSGGLPFTLVLDGNGAIAHRILGRFDAKSLRAKVAQLQQAGG